MLCRIHNCKHTSRPGSAVVEFAILLPFLAFVFVVAVDYSRIFYYSLTIENCARNGAVFGSQTLNTSSWQNSGGTIASVTDATVADGAKLDPPLTASNVTVSGPNTKDADGNSIVSVTVKYQFNTLTKYPGIPNAVNLVRSVQMRIAPP
jgi:Flp pilus assembly protein TadG